MPRILRSPGSKSFRLENVSVPSALSAAPPRQRYQAGQEPAEGRNEGSWRVARKIQFPQSFQADLRCPVPREKKNPLRDSPKSVVYCGHPGPHRGAYRDRHGRWDATAPRAWSDRRADFSKSRERLQRAGRTAQLRTAKPCGPGTRCWCQVGGGVFDPTGSDSATQFADDGGKTNSSPGSAE
jgi:hypothetical protein